MEREFESVWRSVGGIDPEKLVEARLQLHWAAQPVMAFADCTLEHVPDDSQSNLGWRDDFEAVVGRQRPDGLSAGLRIPDMTLLMFDGGGGIAEGVSFEGRTIDEALSLLDSIALELTGKQLDTPTRIRDYEMPEHPLAAGARFVMDGPPAYAELARWFANGNLALNELTSSDNDWFEVRCWPHHFDLGTLTNLVPDSTSIGAGLSPGDNWYPEPYFYVNPYGLADPLSDRPSLDSGGHWHTEGWFGAVLTATAIAANPGGSQEAAVLSFLRGAVDAARNLLTA
jgi:hypothetical protein